MVEKEHQTNWGSLCLAFTGLVLFGLCLAAMIRRQDVLAGTLAVLGLGAMVLAALMPRLTGTVEMGPAGFKIELKNMPEIVKLSEVGKLADYSEDEIRDAIQYRQHLAKSNSQNLLDSAKRALDHGTTASPERAKRLRGLSNALLSQARVFTEPADFEVVIKLARLVLTTTPQDSPEYAEEVRQLASALSDRYFMTETQADRDEIASLLNELESARRRRES